MAETVALKINVDAGNSVKTLGKLEEEIRDIGIEMREVNKINIEFKEKLQELEAVYRKIPKTSLSARKKIKGDMDILKEAITDNNLALQNFRLKKQEVGHMKKDLKKVSHHFERSMDSVLGFGAAIGETVAGFMLLTGASEESTHKIEKALGVMFAFEGMARSVTHSIKIWNENLKGTAVVTKILAVAQSVLNFVTNAGTTAMKSFRIALISTGIGALIVGVGLLIANFGKLINIVGSFFSSNYKANQERIKQLKQAQEELKKIIAIRKEAIKQNFIESEGANKVAQNIIKAGNKKIALAQAEGKSKREILKLQKEERNNTIIGAEKSLEQHRKTKLSLTSISQQLKKVQKGYDLMSKEDQEAFIEKSKAHQEQVNQLKELQKESRKVRDEARQDEKIAQAEARASRKETRKERAKLEKQAIFDLQVAQKQADAEDILDEQKKAEALIEIERFKHEKELENKKLTNAEKELLEFEYQQRIADISQEFVDAEFEREQAEKERLAEIKKEAEEKEKEAKKDKDEQDEIDKDKRIAREQEVQDAKFDLALGGIDALMQLNDAFSGQTEAQQKKAFERNKKLQIAQALISASQGIVNILSNASTIPDPFGTIYKVGQIGILAGVTAAQISKISQAQFSGGGSLNTPNVSGGGSFGGGAPQLQPITNTSTLVPQEAQQVYVTETDISNIQNKVAVIEGQATIK